MTTHPPAKPDRKPRTLAELKAHPWIEDIWREHDGYGASGYSYWAVLAQGLNFNGCSSLHEATVAGLIDALDCVEVGPTR
jgi:hypothetical protein